MVKVDSWADWSGPKHRLTPDFDWPHAFESWLRFAKLAVDPNPQAPSKQAARRIPATPVPRAGHADAHIVGSGPLDRRRADVEQKLLAA